MKSKKNLNHFGGLVYSTNPDAISPEENEEIETLAADKQKLRVRIDSKQRKGKTVTLVENFVGKVEDLEALGKALKTKCGTGGNVKDGQILIQGDVRVKVLEFLKTMGYTQSK